VLAVVVVGAVVVEDGLAISVDVPGAVEPGTAAVMVMAMVVVDARAGRADVDDNAVAVGAFAATTRFGWTTGNAMMAIAAPVIPTPRRGSVGRHWNAASPRRRIGISTTR
jgi:hypothetical protein